jgi:hypothetical protein
VSWLTDILSSISNKVSQILKDDAKLETILKLERDNAAALVKLLANQQSDSAVLAQILAIVAPPPATSFKANISVGGNMTVAHKVSADLAINDDGTALITLSFLDHEGIPTTNVPTGLDIQYGPASDGDPSSFELTPSDDKLTCAVKVVNPPPQPLHTGVTFAVTIAGGLANQTAPIVEQTDPPLDVVAGPAESFVAAVSE